VRHAEHFLLSRLDRLPRSEVDLALELYRDPDLLRAVLAVVLIIGPAQPGHPDAVTYQRAARAFRERDLDAIRETIHESVVWHIPGRSWLGRTVEGRTALMAAIAIGRGPIPMAPRCKGDDAQAQSRSGEVQSRWRPGAKATTPRRNSDAIGARLDPRTGR
jgi:hypothetical protein